MKRFDIKKKRPGLAQFFKNIHDGKFRVIFEWILMFVVRPASVRPQRGRLFDSRARKRYFFPEVDKQTYIRDQYYKTIFAVNELL